MRTLAAVATPGASEPKEAALAAAMRREQRGFDELFDFLSRPISAFAASRGSEDPDGTANIVLYAAFSRLGDFTGTYENFRAYVYRIARNQLVDEHRKRQRRPDYVELVDSHDPGYRDDFVDQTSDRDEALRLIEPLTEGQREVLLLRTVAGLSIEETAQVVGKSITATKQIQLRAVRAVHRSSSRDAGEQQ